MAGAPVETSAVALELDDIQDGAVQERPSPYVGRYLLLRIDDRTAGRELVRRLHALVDAGREPHPVRDARATVAFTYPGLKLALLHGVTAAPNIILVSVPHFPVVGDLVWESLAL